MKGTQVGTRPGEGDDARGAEGSIMAEVAPNVTGRSVWPSSAQKI
jgi:hypothetical protein